VTPLAEEVLVDGADGGQERVGVALREGSIAGVVNAQFVGEEVRAIFQQDLEEAGRVGLRHLEGLALAFNEQFDALCVGAEGAGDDALPGRVSAEDRMRVWAMQGKEALKLGARDARARRLERVGLDRRFFARPAAAFFSAMTDHRIFFNAKRRR
jgi:hypothetical protein